MSKQPQTDARARGIAEKLSANGPMSAIDLGSIISIITQLLPIIMDCFDPDDGPQAQKYVEDRYDESESGGKYRGYDKRLVKAMARRAKQAARRQGMRITWGQAYEAAFTSLDDIREGDTSTASIAIAENHDFLLI